MAVDMMALRRQILSQGLQMKTATGNPVQFRTDLKLPFESARLLITPTQDGSGTPSPDNVRPIKGYAELVVTANGEEITIPCPTIPNTGGANTFYGAEIDLLAGSLHATHWYYYPHDLPSKANVTSVATLGSYTRFWLYAPTVQRTPGTLAICDSLPGPTSVGYAGYSDQRTHFGVSDSYLGSYWCVMPSALVGTTQDSVFEYVKTHPMVFVFERGAGGDYVIRKPDLAPLRGENHFSTNVNQIELSYWTH